MPHFLKNIFGIWWNFLIQLLILRICKLLKNTANAVAET